MAERDQKGAKRAPRKAAAQAHPVTPPTRSGGMAPHDNAERDQRILDLEAERDRLAAALVTAEERIAELERLRRHAIDRIDWVIDSLHSLNEE